MTTYSEEIAFYETKVDELRRGQLKAVQSTATRWSALMTALLGVFGAVAFAGGLNTIDKLPNPVGLVVRAVTTLAAVGAVLAVWYLSRAAGGLKLDDLPNVNGKVLMNREAVLVTAARRNLIVGRRLAVATAGLVLVGSVVVLWAPPASAPVPNLLVRFDDAVVCGKPRLTRSGLAVGGRDLRDAVEVITVSGCPSAGG